MHIKGCDIGRTQEMVELIDEAFGGAGTVTAPTHEQRFSTDSTLARQARDAFRAEVDQRYPMPPEVDAGLTGRDRTAAVAARGRALRERQATIARDEADAVARAGHVSSLSGPMFQRPGTTLFTAAELEPMVSRLYSHLPEARRARLVADLIAPDTRPVPADGHLDMQGQRGQRVDRWILAFPFPEPRTAAEAQALQPGLARAGIRIVSVGPAVSRPVNGGEILEIARRGERRRDRTPWTGSWTSGTQDRPIPTEADLRAQSLRECPNPDRYTWRFEETHAAGTTTRRLIGTRVLAYLHHGSLDLGPHQRFAPPLANPDFYATSTFAPAAPPATGGTP